MSDLRCLKCQSAISAQSKTGLCRACAQSDPDVVARRTEGRRKAFLHHPELRIKHRNAVAASNRQPHRREQSGEHARRLKLWESGLPRITSEVRKRAAVTLSNRLLEGIPLAFRQEYAALVRKIGADSARRVILDHAAKVAARAVGQ